ncbi:MAG: hypothetical protein HY079_07695, partial [Elusimicrobia bacterium]|nr:hypothetical protein [Elusimicrobiota bacterium]
MNRRMMTLTVAALALAAAAPGAAHAGRKHKKRLIVTFQEGLSRAQREQAARDMGLKLTDDVADLGVSVLEAAGDVAPQEVTNARKHPKAAAVEEDEYRTWIFDAVPGLADIERSVHAQAAAARALAGRRPAPRPESGGGSASANAPWGVARVNAPAAWGG